MLEITEGSHAVAEAVSLCRPQVISAYPITPQTHIVEALADFVANGKLDAEYITVENEPVRAFGLHRGQRRGFPRLFGNDLAGPCPHVRGLFQCRGDAPSHYHVHREPGSWRPALDLE